MILVNTSILKLVFFYTYYFKKIERIKIVLVLSKYKCYNFLENKKWRNNKMEGNRNENEKLEGVSNLEQINEHVSESIDNNDIKHETEEKNITKKKNNNIILIISIIIVLFIIIGGYFLMPIILKQGNNNTPEETQDQTSTEEQNGIKYNGELVLYKSKDNDILQTQNESFKEKFILQTEGENPIYLDSFKTYVLYKDNNLNIYDIETKERKSLALDSNYEYYRLLGLRGEKTRIIGIEYGNYDNQQDLGNRKIKENGFYNINLNKKMYENKYGEFRILNNDLMAAQVINLEPQPNPPEKYLLSLNQEKVLLENDNSLGYGIVSKDENNYFIINNLTASYPYPDVDIYTKNLKNIEKNIPFSNYTFDKNKNLFIKDNDNYKKYDINGNLIETIKVDNEKCLGFLSEHLVYLENNQLKIKNLNDNTIYEILKWDDNYKFEGRYSGIISDKNQFIIAISYKDKLDSNGWPKAYDQTYGIEYYYDLNTKKIETKDITIGFTYQAWD